MSISIILVENVQAQVSLQYDSAGNLVTQVNAATAAPPAFEVTTPQYLAADASGQVTISLPVTGAGPFNYQWWFNGAAIRGATNSVFVVSNTVADNLGVYQLVVSYNGGSITSAVVNVSFLDPDGSGLPVGWELNYFGVTGVDPNGDPDGDGVSNYQEYVDGTDPMNPHSVLPRLNIPDYNFASGGTISVVPLKPKYQLGDVVQITALPDPGVFFDGFQGSNAVPVGGSFGNVQPNMTLVMNSTIWLTATFGNLVELEFGVASEVLQDIGDVVAIAKGGIMGLALQGNGTVASWAGVSFTAVPPGLAPVAAIAAGQDNCLALQSNGTVVAWGDNYNGQTNVPAGLSNVVAIAAGQGFCLALQNNGRVVGWGDDSSGAIDVPAGLSNVVAITAGNQHCLAIQENGKVVGWGDDAYGEIDVPASVSNVVAVAAGYDFSLALRNDGIVVGWGYNEDLFGAPDVPAGLSNVVAIAAGVDFSLALRSDGTIVGWGYNGDSQIPPGLSNVVAIAASSTGGDAAALFNNGGAWIVRQPFNTTAYSGTTASLSVGVVGQPPLSYQWRCNGTNIASATNAILNFANVQVANSGVYSLVVSNALARVTSVNAVLEVSDSPPVILAQPVSQAVLAGRSAALSVAAAGSWPLLGYQWQFNGTNIAGATNALLNLANVQPANAGSYGVVVSNAFGMTRSTNASLSLLSTLVVAWGDNAYGETNVPPGLGAVSALAGGNAFSLALLGNGTVRGWGFNNSGQLNVPAGLTNVTAIAAGESFSLALQGNGTVVAWGDDSYNEANVPPGLSNTVAIAAGAYHSLAVQNDGTVVGWGDNSYGETTMPAGLSNVMAVAGGYAFSLALQSNGTVVAWGNGVNGQLNVPAGLSNVVAITAGFAFGAALQSNGTVVAWGDAGYGQINVPAGLTNVAAIAARDFFLLALQTNGTVTVLDDGSYGRSYAQTNLPAGLSNVVAIAAGGYHGLALMNDGAPFILQQPVNANADAGGTASFSANIFGPAPLGYQWQFDGTNLLGATNATLILPKVQSANAGVYSVIVSNRVGTSTSSGATLSVNNVAPTIVGQPANEEVLPGGNAMFAVSATGTMPFSYQWQFNSTNITGATNGTFNLANVQFTNSGVYSVLVSNFLGAVLSGGATLTVSNAAPMIVVPPANQQFLPGGNATFSVAATGYLPLSYQWQWNGTNIVGATNAALNLADVPATGSGAYSVVVSNTFGTAQSVPAILTVEPELVVAWGDDANGQTNVPPGLGMVTAIAAGQLFSMALQGNGTVAAWGDDSDGQTNLPPDLTNVVAIAAGNYFSMALQSNGTVSVWGDDGGGETNVPPGLSNVVAIAAGGAFCLALQSNGTVAAWGDDYYGEAEVPLGLSNVVALAGGEISALALRRDGTVVGWGYSGAGQTTAPAGLSNVVAIASGQYFSLALQSDGTVAAWGDDGAGEIEVPAGLSNVVAIAAGNYFGLALRSDGTLVTWGDDSYGQLDLPLGLTNVVAIAGGGEHTMAVYNNGSPYFIRQPVSALVYSGVTASLSAASVGLPPLSYQWQFDGTNLRGATNAALNLANMQTTNTGTYRVLVSNSLGTVTSSNAVLTVIHSAPVFVSQPANQEALPGGNAAFSVVAAGSLPLLSYQWQFNGTNIAGATNITLNLTNVSLTSAGAYSVVVSNAFGATQSANAALTVGPSVVVAWGEGNYGQTNVPPGLTNVVALAGGQYFSLALQGNGRVTAWGDNRAGQTTVPAGLSNVVAIAAGDFFSLALRANGTVAAWGDNSAGQTNVPAGLSNVVAIAAGNYFSVALQSSGLVTAWGDNSGGQANVPAGLSNVVAIAAGHDHGLALLANGTVMGWGADWNGQLDAPPGLQNVVAIAAGQYFSVALQDDGTVVAWGDGGWGQIQVPANLTNVVAIAAGDFFLLALQSNGTVTALGDGSYGQSFGQLNVPAGLNDVAAIAAGGYHSLALINSGSPFIARQPSSEIVYSGGPALLSAGVASPPPVGYQWRFDGTNIVGATHATLNLSNVQAANTGLYSVVVSNALGAITSSVAAVAVIHVAPVIVVPPGNQQAPPGGNAVFSVVASGSLPLLGYQWQFNGMNLPGATNVTLNLSNVQFPNQGGYSVVVSNAFGTTASASGVLTVVPAFLTAWGNDDNGQTNVPSALGPVAAIAGGEYFSLALLGNGTVTGWGDDSDSQLDPPWWLNNVTAIAAGNYFSLALQNDGTVVGWGDDTYGQVDIPGGLYSVLAIAAGQYFSLALQGDGTVVGWGDNSAGETNVPSGLNNAVAIAGGQYFSLALLNDGTVAAWGDNTYGQTNVPPTMSNVVAIAAGQYFGLALQGNGTVVGWGDDSVGEIDVPAGLSNVVAIAAGAYFGLALQSNGVLVAWGDNTYGQTNAPLTNVVAIAAGGYHALAAFNNGLPYFTQPPVSTNVFAGGAASFSVSTFGLPPLGYQWQFDGTNLVGATNATLNLVNVQSANAGVYSVLVANTMGMVSSPGAILAVSNTAPIILAQPANQEALPGGNASFTVATMSALPLYYQWQFNGTNLSGATNATLNVVNVPATGAGQYSVLLSNHFGTTLSANAALTVGPVLVVAWGFNFFGETNVPPGLTNVVALAGGAYSSLALENNGTVAGWGFTGNAPAGISNVMAIAAGFDHNLALQSNGTVVAWGDDSYGEIDVPAGLSNVVAVAAGQGFSLAVQRNGTVTGWGDNGSGEVNVPAGLSNVVAVAAGDFFSLALKADGTVAAWGDDSSGEIDVPAGLNHVVAIAAGELFSLALRADGTVVAWGDDGAGEIDVPVGLTNVVAIGSGVASSLALLGNGTVTGWGDDGAGEIEVPAGLSNAVAIAAGGYHSLALFNDGAPFINRQPASETTYSGTSITLGGAILGTSPIHYQWRLNGTNLVGATNAALNLVNVPATASGVYSVLASNSLGLVTSSNLTLTVIDSAPIIQVQPVSQQFLPGENLAFSVAVTGSLPLSYQWRFNGTNLAGANQATLNLANVSPASAGVYNVVVSNAHGTNLSASAVLSLVSPSVVAWGYDGSGQANVPPGLTNVMAIAGGDYFSLALQSNGLVVGWGDDGYGQADAPAGLSSAVAIAAGGYFSLALQSNGTVVAWGNNSNGQTNVPAGLSNVVAIAAGEVFSLALQSNGTVVAWGDNTYGQTNPPPGLSNVVAIAAGGNHALALEGNGALVGWGFPSSVPTGMRNVVAIAAGYYFSLALQADGTVVSAEFGGSPVSVGLSNVVAIAAGLALEKNGLVTGWGDNTYGQTNIPAGLSNVVAIAAGGLQELAIVSDGFPVIHYQPSSQNASAGSSVWFNVGAASSVPLSYQWRFNGTNIAGATNAALNLANVQLAYSGMYSVLVSNALGSLSSAGATLLVSNVAPTFAVQPANAEVLVGASVALSASAIGTLPIGYQWQFNGTNIAGATNTVLNLANVQPANSGVYTVVASNRLGIANSAGASLTVGDVAPTIVGQPSYQEVQPGGNAAFSVVATGPVPLDYQWQFDGTNLAGATNATFNLANVQLANSGLYTAVVSNPVGSITSSPAKLLVDNSAPVIFVPPASQEVQLGATVIFSVDGFSSTGVNFQWQLNGTNIPGAYDSYQLVIPYVNLSDAGNYSVILVNNYGMITSANATLTVGPSVVVAWGDNANSQTNVPLTVGNVTALAGGGNFSLALETNGTVTGWGYAGDGAIAVPAGLSNVVAIAAGYNFSLALQSNGTVSGWGNSTYGQSLTPVGLSNVVAIAAGSDFSLALVGGEVVGWGDANYGQLEVPVGLSNVVAIAAGGYASLALAGNGTVAAWGNDQYGQTNVPAGLNHVVAIAVGGTFDLALKSNGTVVAWGDNTYGQTNVPAGLSNVVAIAAGADFSLAVLGNNTVVAWGDNTYGQTNVLAGLGNVVAIAAGYYHSLALLNFGAPVINGLVLGGSLNAYSGWTNAFGVSVGGAPPLSYQWQFNGTNLVGATNATLYLADEQPSASGVYDVIVNNSLGSATSAGAVLTVSNSPPIILAQPANQTVLDTGNVLFSVAATGSLPLTYQWRLNGITIAGATNATLYVANAGLSQSGSLYSVLMSNAFGTNVSANAALTVGRSLVVAWGDNSYGQANVPPGLSNAVAVAAGEAFSLALQGSGVVTGWGDDAYGEMDVPAGLTNVTAIAAGSYHGLALRNNGTVTAWGMNFEGQTNVPAGLSNVVAIAAGGLHSLALKGDGTVVGWGGDTYGEIDVPPGLSNVVAIAAGGDHSLALQNNGTVVAWGEDSDGQTDVPAGLSNVVAIAAGSFHSLALLNGGAVVAWGDNTYGQTNSPVKLSHYYPGVLPTIGERPILVISGLTNAAAIAAGDFFNLGIPYPDGLLSGWGDSTNGQDAVPSVLTNTVAIAGGGGHGVAIYNNGSPWIIRQPLNASAYSGASVMLNVGVAGLPPLSYQWQFNGMNLSGATNASLAMVDAQPTNSGIYSLIVGNALGLVTSSNAVVSVINSAPVFMVPPANQAVPLGASATVSVVASGSLPLLGYQWQFNGTNIVGATNITLNFASVAATNAGAYRVAVSNAFGTSLSPTATLELRPPNDLFANRLTITGSSNTLTGSNAYGTREPGEPEIEGNPGGSSVWWTWTAPTNGVVTVNTLGSSFNTLLGVYTGGYVWNLTLVASDANDGSSPDSLVTFAATAGTTYQIVVDGFNGATGTVMLTVSEPVPGPPTLAASLQNQTADLGGSATFQVLAAGTGPFSYQWLKNGTNLGVASQPTFTLDNLQPGDAAVYSVIVSNVHGSVTNSASLSVYTGPPNDAFVNAILVSGGSALLTGTNILATKEPGEPNHGGNAGGSSVWWQWIAPTNGLVTVDTTGSSFITLLAVYTGNSVGNLTAVANDYGEGGYRTYFGSHLAFSATAGTAYEIAVDGYGGAAGDIVLNLQQASQTVVSNQLAISSSTLISNGQFQLSVLGGLTGQSCRIQGSTNLIDWTTLTNFNIGNMPFNFSESISPNYQGRFYRVVSP